MQIYRHIMLLLLLLLLVPSHLFAGQPLMPGSPAHPLYHYPNLVQVPEKAFTTGFVAFTKGFTFQPAGWESLKPYNVVIINRHKISEANVVGTHARILSKGKRQTSATLKSEHRGHCLADA
jgi:hypothetical protein